ncbi:MAG: serine hydrolase domain-containing protein, partial [Terriglobales bacterium]
MEKVTGKSYGEFLGERIFRPLEMQSTTFLDQEAIIQNFSPGYTMTNDGRLIRNRRYSQVELSPAYGILSTARDLAAWELALLAGRLLPKSALEQMWKPVRLSGGGQSNYGFGWQLDVLRGHRVVEHAGGTGTAIFRLPDDRLTVIILTNLTLGSTNNPYGIAHAVAAHYIHGLSFAAIPAERDTNPNLTAKLRTLLGEVATGRENPELLLGAVSEDRRQAVRWWVKDMESFTFLACDPARGSDLDRFGVAVSQACYYRQTGGDETRYYRFYLTPENKVADFWSHTE